MLSGYEKFPKYLLNFSYILFDVNRYNEDELYRAANLISSVFVLDQTMGHREMAGRLRKLTGILKEMTQDEFRQIVTNRNRSWHPFGDCQALPDKDGSLLLLLSISTY
ncbi:hypothetical protein P378_12155 [Desulforamulus profundi]|uniref:Uncharacterized protein n=2 Tax=Desulforamulus profundi TaxID=1383067 RepID=A0A2C6MEH5_9FIRM|nr:hypothetical protein P378_12155 [Desulforamulus profundi]